MLLHTEYLDIHWIRVTANNSSTKNVFFFCFRFENPRSQFLGQEKKKYFESLLIWIQDHLKLSKENSAESLTLIIIPRKAKFIVGYTNFKLQTQSISALVIWLNLSEVIWLLFKTQMKDGAVITIISMGCIYFETPFT